MAFGCARRAPNSYRNGWRENRSKLELCVVMPLEIGLGDAFGRGWLAVTRVPLGGCKGSRMRSGNIPLIKASQQASVAQMSGDELAIRLFVGATAISCLALAVTQAGWTNKVLVILLFILAAVLGASAVLFWPQVSSARPGLTETLAKVSESAFGWFGLLTITLLIVFILDLGVRVGWLGSTSSLADRAEFHLRFYGDHRTPTATSTVNIWRWYMLRNSLTTHILATGEQATATIVDIFVTFDNPVKVGTLELRSNDFIVPKHEVKEFNNRFTIIAADDLPAGVLDIVVRND
jgi:hypothetical protein